MQALKIAATGMSAQQTRVDVTSNNIANMSTTAYDRRRASFADLHYQVLRAPGTLSAQSGERLPVGVELGFGVGTVAVAVDRRQGALRATGGELNVAVEGDGYFEVELPGGGTAFTRDGAFQLSADGVVVNQQGFTLADAITVPQDARAIEISADGTVTAVFEDGARIEQLGEIALARFVNAPGLTALGDNLFLETEASGPALRDQPGIDGRGFLRQGFLEDSSVDVVAEITELIEAQRGYELNARVLAAADEMLGATARIR
ncbi:MAG: flagellar basal-body rod protein FlgG [Pseudomonadota bacterium]